MSPRTVGEIVVRKVPLLGVDQDVGSAVAQIVEAEVPALPVTDRQGALRGIFGEREFIGALFPGYLGELKYAGFVTRAIDDQIDRRAGCRSEPVSKYMNTEHIDVGPDYSDAEIAETFLHHRVLIVPIVDERQVTGVITRWDFFKAVAERFAERG